MGCCRQNAGVARLSTALIGSGNLDKGCRGLLPSFLALCTYLPWVDGCRPAAFELPEQAQPPSPVTWPSICRVLAFLAHTAATLPLSKVSEPLTLIFHINQVMGTSGEALLSELSHAPAAPGEVIPCLHLDLIGGACLVQPASSPCGPVTFELQLPECQQ